MKFKSWAASGVVALGAAFFAVHQSSEPAEQPEPKTPQPLFVFHGAVGANPFEVLPSHIQQEDPVEKDDLASADDVASADNKVESKFPEYKEDPVRSERKRIRAIGHYANYKTSTSPVERFEHIFWAHNAYRTKLEKIGDIGVEPKEFTKQMRESALAAFWTLQSQSPQSDIDKFIQIDRMGHAYDMAGLNEDGSLDGEFSARMLGEDADKRLSQERVDVAYAGRLEVLRQLREAQDQDITKMSNADLLRYSMLSLMLSYAQPNKTGIPSLDAEHRREFGFVDNEPASLKKTTDMIGKEYADRLEKLAKTTRQFAELKSPYLPSPSHP